MRSQCRKCGEYAFVIVCPEFELVTGWYLSATFPFVHYGLHQRRVGFLVRCTRHGCGREWSVTPSGMFEPGITTPARIAAAPATPPRERDRERESDREPEGPLRGAVPRADV